jgi:hypothetical protein
VFKNLIRKLSTNKAITIMLVVALCGMLAYEAVPRVFNNIATGVKDVFTLTNSATQATGVADATCDGVADNVQALALVSALPATGGRVYILTGTYVWANGTTVTDASPAVTISGTGYGTYITALDGVTSPFTAGANNWVLENMRFNVTTAVLTTAMGATTGWEWHNITTSDGYFAYRTDNATTGTSWNIPTGRTATYTIAASDAPAHVKAQADEVLTGASMETQINAALVTLNGYSGRPLLQLVGSFTCDGEIVVKSDVDVEVQGTITVTSDTAANGINFNSVTNAVWSGFELHRVGTPVTSDYRNGTAILIQGTCDNTLELRNFKSYNDCTGTLYVASGIVILDSSAPIIDGFYAKGGGTVVGVQNAGVMISQSVGNKGYIRNGVAQGGNGGWANGVIEEEQSLIDLSNVVGYGGVGAAACGLFADNEGSVRWDNCTGYGGDSGVNNDGVIFHGSNTNICYNLKGVPGRYQDAANENAGIRIDQLAAPILINPVGILPMIEANWIYVSDNNGRFKPTFPVHPAQWDYYIYSFQVYNQTAAPGVTLDIGTSIGGSQIALNIDISAADNSPKFVMSRPLIYGSDYMYATVNGGAPGAGLRFYYTVQLACFDAATLTLETSGNAIIEGGSFIGMSQTKATVRIKDTTWKNWKITNSNIFCPATPTFYSSLIADAAITDVPIYNTVINGRVMPNITSFAKGSQTLSSSGTWIVLNGQNHVHITHGLGWTPVAGDIAIGFTTLDASTACFIDGYSATEFVVNINVNATAATTTGWWKAIR